MVLRDGGKDWVDDGAECGNPYPFCRCFPWLPRGWWVAAPAAELERIAGMSREDELRMLRQQGVELHARLKKVRSLISSLERQGDFRQGGKTK